MSIRVFAPATVSNVACGFDIFGFALDTPGDEIVVTKADTTSIAFITGDKGKLPLDPKKNVATIAVNALTDHLGIDDRFAIEIHKKMPLGSGLGSSAASSVGAVFAVNTLLDTPLTREELLTFALAGEMAASGAAHADNVAPSLLGGFILIRSYDPLDVIKVPVNLDLWCVVLHSDVEVLTKEARKMLPSSVSLQNMITQTGHAAALMVGLIEGDPEIVRRALHDAVIEEVRSPLVPNFHAIKAAALNSGALGCSLSGSGPSIFALTTTKDSAEEIAQAMKSACNVKHTLYLSKINLEGPKVLS